MVLFIIFSCKNDSDTKVDVSNIKVDYKIKRYEVDFYNANKNSLKKIKKEYPFLFPKSFTDSIALAKIKDNDEQELFKETQKEFSNFSLIEAEITSLFKHIKYYNPKFNAPNVVTITTNIDYDSRVIYADSLLLVSIDNYLGSQHKFYRDYPKYIKVNNTKERLVVDIAQEIIEQQISPLTKRDFISKIIHEGKKMYALDLYLQNVPNEIKIGYLKNKLNWAKSNEEEIWSYFIEKEYLFSTDTKLNKRFIENAPFSKFYLAQDNLSPGRIGVWLGWQIVKSFMKNNNVSLQELFLINESEIFKKSKYKPKK